MEFRKHLLGGQAAIAGLVVVTAVIAFASLSSLSARAVSAHANTRDALRLLARVREQSDQLVDLTRRYLSEREGELLAKLSESRRTLEAHVDRLAARERIVEGPRSWRMVDEADGLIAWLARAAAEGMTTGVFDGKLETQRAGLFAQLYALEVGIERHGEDRLARARALAERAKIGIVVASTFAIVLGFVLAASLRRKLAARYRRLRVALTVANRDAAARKELAEIVAHDLRTPLNAVALSASLLRDAKPREAELCHVDRIVSAAERMEHLLDDLSEVTRFDAETIELHHERFDTRSLLVSCIEMFSARAKERGVHLKTDSRDILTVRADRERLMQIVGNLMNNALRFTTPGGIITTVAEPHATGVRFAITDTGPGIAVEDQVHVFDRYWQGPERRGRNGVGLGLYICKQLVEAHGGHIGVDSELGRGTTFWFVIPT
jgi:signal transduction histidine kinase